MKMCSLKGWASKEAAGRSKQSVAGKKWDEKTLETTVEILEEILNVPRHPFTCAL